MAVYKVSYVVKGSNHPGGIVNLDYEPKAGEEIHLGNLDLKVIEVIELVPPRRDFHYIHVTCELVQGK